ncbi:MAG TPA: MFS transporter [Ktedonobacterales bacterium]|nr:MFS transporter [Ktedonobacterales bacterium]
METIVSDQPKPTWLARLLINRQFALLWSGQSISYLGDYVFDTTLLLWIAASIARGQSWGPLAVSGLLAATALPALLVGPIAGVFVDRWDKRRTMLWADALRAGLIASLLLATNIVPLPFLLAVPIFFLLGVCNAGVIVVLVPLRLQITPRELIGRASSIDGPVITLSSLVATALAGYLDSVVLRNFHAALWGVRFASVDTLLLGAGALVVLGGLYAMVNLRHLPLARQDVKQPAAPAEVVGAASSD